MIQVRLFGPIEISLNGQPLPRLRSKKGRWLIALLALRVGKPLNREWLAQTLWPDQDLTSAKAYLRQTLTELRTVLGPASALLQSPDPQHLSLSLEVRVDLAEFDAAIAHDPQAAVALYTARLLEDCDEEWAIEARRTSEAILAETLANLGERAAPFQAVAYFARLVELDPFRESAQRSLIKALFELGDDAAATKAYRVFKLLLHRELHTEPSPETTALYRELRARIVEKNALVASGFQIGSQPASENHAPNGARLSTGLLLHRPLRSASPSFLLPERRARAQAPTFAPCRFRIFQWRLGRKLTGRMSSKWARSFLPDGPRSRRKLSAAPVSQKLSLRSQRLFGEWPSPSTRAPS